ncbi:MAG TPA: hypothetical protein VF064_01850 [Pyrinomonadaceae bacterium]
MFPFALFIVGSKLLHKGKRLAPACALFVLLGAAVHTPRATQRGARGGPAAAARTNGVPRLRPSNILDDLRKRAEGQPRPAPRELAAHANDLLARKGFDYRFDACEMFASAKPVERDETEQPATVVYPYRLTREDGGGPILFHLVGEADGSMCGECYFPLPALRVTKREMFVVADGVRYRLRRPTGFMLDEAHLVDSTLRRVLRTWQMPFQTIPAGISPDGKLLYLSFYDDTGLGDLVLEVSEGGTPRFAVRKDVIEGEGEWIEDHPKDPKNAYLSFMRFRSGGRSHVVRFSGPCT